MLRIELKTVPYAAAWLGPETTHVLYAESVQKKPAMVWFTLHGKLHGVDTGHILSLQVGPKAHPEHYGCKVCPIEEPCRHVAAVRSCNNSLGDERL